MSYIGSVGDTRHPRALTPLRNVRRQFKVLLVVTVAAGGATLQLAPAVGAQPSSSASSISRVALINAESRPPRFIVSATPPSRLVPLPSSTTTTVASHFVSVTNPAVALNAPTGVTRAFTNVAPSMSWVNNSLWSGYLSVARQFSGVSGDWTVPAVTCNSPLGAWASQWIGIGGYHDPRLIQVGTDTDCLSGQATYYAWYEYHSVAGDAVGFKETVPSPTLFPLHAGDHMHASIALGKSRVVVLTNYTEHWSYRTPIVPMVNFGAAGTVEWVTEDEPGADGVSQGLLPNFGSVHFEQAIATVPGRSATLVHYRRIGINLVFHGEQLAVTSSLGSNGSSFNEQWLAAR